MGIKAKKVPPKSKAVVKRAGEISKSRVETRTVGVEKKAQRPRVTFEDDNHDDNSTARKAAAAAARRMESSGIIKSKKRLRDENEDSVPQELDDEAEDQSDVDDLESSGSDDESIGSDDFGGDSSDDDHEESDKKENPFEKAKREGTRLSYSVLRLRFLPPEFQETELFKFFSQFGAKVLNCFCVRSRRTHQSKGIAYVQFDDESVLPIVVEECHGMALGGFCVQARVAVLHRPMPPKEKVKQRRQLAYAYKTKGISLQQHDVRYKNPIAALIKYSKTEKKNNAQLKALGIDYACHDFCKQLERVPPSALARGPKEKCEEIASKRGVGSNDSSRVSGKKQNGSSNANGVAGGRKKNKGGGVRSTVVSSSSVATVPASNVSGKNSPVNKKGTYPKQRKQPQEDKKTVKPQHLTKSSSVKATKPRVKGDTS